MKQQQQETTNFLKFYFNETRQEQTRMREFSNFSKHLAVNYKNKQT